MNQEMISNLLAKLKEKTGRDWTVSDLAQLARMLPRLNEKNIDSVLEELGNMGLEVSDLTRKKLKQTLQEQQTLHVHRDPVSPVTPESVKKVKRSGEKAAVPSLKKSRHETLRRKLRRLQAGRKVR